MEFYQFLFGFDSLGGDEWDPRDLLAVHDDEGGAIVDIALNFAARLG